MIESYQNRSVSDMLFKHFVKMTPQQQEAIDFASNAQLPRKESKRTMSDENLRAGVEKVTGSTTAPRGNFTERLNALKPQATPSPEPKFDGSMFNLPQAKGPEMPENAPEGTQMISGRADYSNVAPTNNPEKEAAKPEFGGFDSESFRDMFGQQVENAPYQDRRIKSGGAFRNTADATMDRLSAIRRGKLPTAANAAESQRLSTRMTPDQQARRVRTQQSTLEREKRARATNRQDTKMNTLMSRAPGSPFAGTKPREVQGALKAGLKEGSEPATAGSTTQTGTQTETEQPSVEEATRVLSTGNGNQRNARGGGALFGGKDGGVKIPGVRAAANYSARNPGKTGAMLGLPAAYAMFGGALEEGINLARRGFDAIQQRQNPTITRSLAEYNPELSILLKTQAGMRARRDIRSTEVIRYAYG